MAFWLLGYPDAARKDAYDAVTYAREIGQAATLMYALVITPFTLFNCGDTTTANAQLEEALQLATEKDAQFWKAWGTMQRGCVLAMTGQYADAVEVISSGISAWRSTGSTYNLPLYLNWLGRAFAMIGQLDEAQART
jgi:hypothetical protein